LAAVRDATTSTTVGDDTAVKRRRRNAAQTRQLLLEVARTRFARDGYATTTVRDVADAAGVNVALINRYFTSKEGLFEACLATAVNDIRRDADLLSRDDVAAAITRRIAGSNEAHMHEALMLLLRSSGDERVDGIRRAVLRAVSERLASATSGQQEFNDQDPLLLRAQIVIAATMGLVLLRSSVAAQPISSASEEDLLAPLSDLVNALLPTAPPNTATA
jgi:AcrR family transcriptional regulator